MSMGFSSFVSIVRGIKIPAENWDELYNNLWEFSENHDSVLIDEAAEHHNKDREEIDGDDLKEYLGESGKLVWSEYLDYFFIGFNLLTIEVFGDNRHFNLTEITGISKTIDDDSISEFINKYYKDYLVNDFLVEWTC